MTAIAQAVHDDEFAELRKLINESGKLGQKIIEQYSGKIDPLVLFYAFVIAATGLAHDDIELTKDGFMLECSALWDTYSTYRKDTGN